MNTGVIDYDLGSHIIVESTMLHLLSNSDGITVYYFFYDKKFNL